MAKLLISDKQKESGAGAGVGGVLKNSQEWKKKLNNYKKL